MPGYKFSKRHRTVVRLEAHSTGVLDFSKTNIKRNDLNWKIKKRLVLGHTTRNMLLKIGTCVRGLEPDTIEDMFNIFLGTDSPEESDVGNKIKHINSKTLFEMSDEDRKKLYDSIVASVLNGNNKTVQ